jgi:FtsP/CotA-like multicopper oxidase with cupredoxin domain
VLCSAALAVRGDETLPAASDARLPAGVDASSVEARLLREFAPSYSARAPHARYTREYSLRAAQGEVEVADGHELAVWSYNGQVPGPTLRVRLGEAVRIELTNDLPQPTTIHWHGVRVPNAMDGVPGVTQPPVEPGESFVYEFTPKDAGTFWFHPHVRGSEQIERGLYGVLVVEDRRPLEYSHDVVWVLDDWLLDADGQIHPEFNTRRDLAHDGRWGNVVVVNASTRTELVVKPGERIRLRLVDSANGRVFAPHFAGLRARVIAVDGMYTRTPLNPIGFELAPGNRLDLDIVIPHDAAGRTFEITDHFTRRPLVLARIRVEDTAPVATPTFAAPSNPHVPEWREALELEPTETYHLDARAGGPLGIEWTINGKPWGDHDTTRLPAGRWAKIRFVNDSYRLHPMHIHGQFFKVLARNGAAVEESTFRDTVLLRREETVDVGMVPLDWGKWLMHCHILEHAESGMRTLVEVGERQ